MNCFKHFPELANNIKGIRLYYIYVLEWAYDFKSFVSEIGYKKIPEAILP